MRFAGNQKLKEGPSLLNFNSLLEDAGARSSLQATALQHGTEIMLRPALIFLLSYPHAHPLHLPSVPNHAAF